MNRQKALIATGDKPVIRAFRIQPTSGRLSSETPNDGQRRVPLRSGWTPSLHAHGGNVPAGRRAKTPKVKGGHRLALRATNPFKTLRLAYFSRKLEKIGTLL